MQQAIPIDAAVAIRRVRGANVIFINQSATDVYIDSNPNRLNLTAPGATPQGTRLVAAGGQAVWSSYPGVFYARAAAATTLEVQP